MDKNQVSTVLTLIETVTADEDLNSADMQNHHPSVVLIFVSFLTFSHISSTIPYYNAPFCTNNYLDFQRPCFREWIITCHISWACLLYLLEMNSRTSLPYKSTKLSTSVWLARVRSRTGFRLPDIPEIVPASIMNESVALTWPALTATRWHFQMDGSSFTCLQLLYRERSLRSHSQKPDEPVCLL